MCKEIGGMKYFTPKEVADRAGLSRSTVRRWAEAGLIPVFRDLSGRLYFRPEVVEKLSSQQQRFRQGLAGTGGHQALIDDGEDLIPASVAAETSKV